MEAIVMLTREVERTMIKKENEMLLIDSFENLKNPKNDSHGPRIKQFLIPKDIASEEEELFKGPYRSECLANMKRIPVVYY